MSGLETGPSIGRRKWEKLEIVLDQSDGPYDRLKISCERIFYLSQRFPTEMHEKQKSQAPFFIILVDLLMGKEQEKSIFSFPKFSHTC